MILLLSSAFFFTITMAKISTSKRVIRGISYFDKILDKASSFDLCVSQQEALIPTSVAATEIEMRSKNRSDVIPMNQINQEKGAKSIKRKKGSKPLKEKTTFGKKNLTMLHMIRMEKKHRKNNKKQQKRKSDITC